MYEDALCNNPCGLEPMGCKDCLGFSFLNPDDLYRHNLAYDEDLTDYNEE